MIQPLNESQGSSPLQGHCSWLMCEVALSCQRYTKYDIGGFEGGIIPQVLYRN